MSKEAYTYKRKALTAAKDLLYPQPVIDALHKATTESEIARIMKTEITRED